MARRSERMPTNIRPSESSSSVRIASVIKIIRFSFAAASSSPPSIIPAGNPGIIDAIFDKDPLHLVSLNDMESRELPTCSLY